MDLHKKWMAEAFSLAQQALDVGEVPVGCVFVYRNEIIGRGRNRTNELRNVCIHHHYVIRLYDVIYM
jgi:tRNA-specific adenosine deaminase 2